LCDRSRDRTRGGEADVAGRDKTGEALSSREEDAHPSVIPFAPYKPRHVEDVEGRINKGAGNADLQRATDRRWEKAGGGRVDQSEFRAAHPSIHAFHHPWMSCRPVPSSSFHSRWRARQRSDTSCICPGEGLGDKTVDVTFFGLPLLVLREIPGRNICHTGHFRSPQHHHQPRATFLLLIPAQRGKCKSSGTRRRGRRRRNRVCPFLGTKVRRSTTVRPPPPLFSSSSTSWSRYFVRRSVGRRAARLQQLRHPQP